MRIEKSTPTHIAPTAAEARKAENKADAALPAPTDDVAHTPAPDVSSLRGALVLEGLAVLDKTPAMALLPLMAELNAEFPDLFATPPSVSAAPFLGWKPPASFDGAATLGFSPEQMTNVLRLDAMIESGEVAVSDERRQQIADIAGLVRQSFSGERTPPVLTADQTRAISRLQNAALATFVAMKGTICTPRKSDVRLDEKGIDDLIDGFYRPPPSAADGDIEIPGPAVLAFERGVRSVLDRLGGMDVEMLVQVVMMECARSASDDVREILDEMKKSHAASKALREQTTRAKQQRAAADSKLTSEYNRRCALAKDDPAYIDRSLVSLEDYKRVQLLEVKDGFRLGVSPNQTYYDFSTATGTAVAEGSAAAASAETTQSSAEIAATYHLRDADLRALNDYAAAFVNPPSLQALADEIGLQPEMDETASAAAVQAFFANKAAELQALREPLYPQTTASGAVIDSQAKGLAWVLDAQTDADAIDGFVDAQRAKLGALGPQVDDLLKAYLVAEYKWQAHKERQRLPGGAADDTWLEQDAAAKWTALQDFLKLVAPGERARTCDYVELRLAEQQRRAADGSGGSEDDLVTLCARLLRWDGEETKNAYLPEVADGAVGGNVINWFALDGVEKKLRGRCDTEFDNIRNSGSASKYAGEDLAALHLVAKRHVAGVDVLAPKYGHSVETTRALFDYYETLTERPATFEAFLQASASTPEQAKALFEAAAAVELWSAYSVDGKSFEEARALVLASRPPPPTPLHDTSAEKKADEIVDAAAKQVNDLGAVDSAIVDYYRALVTARRGGTPNPSIDDAKRKLAGFSDTEDQAYVQLRLAQLTRDADAMGAAPVPPGAPVPARNEWLKKHGFDGEVEVGTTWVPNLQWDEISLEQFNRLFNDGFSKVKKEEKTNSFGMKYTVYYVETDKGGPFPKYESASTADCQAIRGSIASFLDASKRSFAGTTAADAERKRIAEAALAPAPELQLVTTFVWNGAPMILSTGTGAAETATTAPAPDRKPPPHFDGLVEMTLAEVDAQIEGWEKQRESQNELTEEVSLKLQLCMERYTKLNATLSNLMKKLADTSSGIVANMK